MLQIALLPGLLVLLTLGYRRPVTVLALAFPISVIINHFIVVLFASLGIYSVWTLWLITAAELIAIWRIYQRSDAVFYDWGSEKQQFVRFYDFAVDRASPNPSKVITTLNIGALIIGGLAFFSVVVGWVDRWGTIISELDAVVSWNRWALNWVNNQPPIGNMFYPQLLPTLLSITYKYIGTSDIQFFSKAVPGLFSVFGVINFIVLAFMFPKYMRLFFFSAFFYFYYLDRTLEGLMYEAYADSIISYFLTALILLIFMIQKSKENRETHVLLLGLILAGGIAAKQGGWYLLLLFPFLISFSLAKSAEDEDYLLRPSSPHIWKLAYGLGIGFILILPWYFHQFSMFAAGTDKPNTGLLIDAFVGSDVFRHIKDSLLRIPRHSLLIVFGTIGLLFSSSFRWVTLLFTIPYSFVWAYAFSYDFRNLGPVVPAYALTTAVGANVVFSWIENIKVKLPGTHLKTVLRRHPALLSLPIVVLLCLIFNDRVLYRRQDFLQRRIGLVDVNKALYEYFANPAKQGKIITNYQFLSYLPELKTLSLPASCGNRARLIYSLEKFSPRYFFTEGCDSDAQKYLNDLVATGKASIIMTFEDAFFNYSDGVLYEFHY